jgi:SAM-dependent methyltransferase
VTTWANVGGRTTTKAAEVSLRALALPPDAIFVRHSLGVPASGRLRDAIVVAGDEWPERAWHRALGRLPESLGRRLELSFEQPDPLFESVRSEPVLVRLVTDVSHPDAYASLAMRLRAWSRGGIVLLGPDDVIPAAGEVRIGERAPPSSNAAVLLEIVPTEKGAAPRERAARPDWHGTADAPAGAVHDFVRAVLDVRELPPLAQGYADNAFAEIYCARSAEGSLRDHALVDPIIERALPVGARLAASRVLDVGCGWGRWAQRLTARGARVVGIEPSPAMAARAREQSLDRFELHVGTLLEAPLSGFFDIVLASMSLDHEPELGRVLRRISHVLAPRGRLVVSTEHPLRTATMRGGRWTADRSARIRDYLVPGPRDHAWFGRGERVRVYHRTVEEWTSALTRAGLRIVSIHEPGDASMDAGVPRFWTIVAERPGPPPALVTIDGTAGSGKTTLARKLAAALGWEMLDTGELRRAMVLRNARDPSRSAGVGLEDGIWRVGGVALSGAEFRHAPLAEAGFAPLPGEEDSFIAAALERPCVMVGRSLGRYYDAAVRAYLDAPPAVRADRHGVAISDVTARDERDRARGRLLPPDVGALELDGTASLDDLAADLVRTVADLGLRPTPV